MASRYPRDLAPVGMVDELRLQVDLLRADLVVVRDQHVAELREQYVRIADSVERHEVVIRENYIGSAENMVETLNSIGVNFKDLECA